MAKAIASIDMTETTVVDHDWGYEITYRVPNGQMPVFALVPRGITLSKDEKWNNLVEGGRACVGRDAWNSSVQGTLSRIGRLSLPVEFDPDYRSESTAPGALGRAQLDKLGL